LSTALLLPLEGREALLAAHWLKVLAIAEELLHDLLLFDVQLKEQLLPLDEVGALEQFGPL